MPLGSGLLDWSGIGQALHAVGYDRWWSIENFNGVDAGIDRLATDAGGLADLLTVAQSAHRS